VVNGLGLELGMLGLTDVGLVLDVLLGLDDLVAEVGDVTLKSGLLNAEDVLEEGGGVSDIGVGGVDLTLDTSDLLVVLDGSLLVSLLSGLELTVKVLNDLLDGGDQLVQWALGHQVQLG